MEKIKLKIAGMSCASCANTIERSIGKLEGVRLSTVNFANESGYFEIEELGLTALVKNEIVALGYTINEESDTDANPLSASSASLPKLYIALALSLAIFSLAMWPLMGWPSPRLNWLLQLLLATPVWIWIGGKFQKAALRFFTSGISSMNTLIGLGTSAAYVYSFFITVFPQTALELGLTAKVYFEAVGFIISFVYLGQYLESKAKKKAKEAIHLLLQMAPKIATVVRQNEEFAVKIAEINVGDTVRVRPGEKIAVDGIITRGTSSIDESMISGEPIPKTKQVQDAVFSGTINGESILEFRATKVGSDTFLSQIVQFVENAQNSKPPIQRYADKISSIFVPVVIAIAGLTFLYWFFVAESGGWGVAISNMIAVLVIACPCALGLATPTAVIVATGRASLKGILIGGGEIIEKAAHLQAIVFDKTGTLTEGKPAVIQVKMKVPDEMKFVQAVGSIEYYSEHPISKALVKWAKSKDPHLQLADPDTFEIIAGKGIQAELNDESYLIGSRQLMIDHHIDMHHFLGGEQPEEPSGTHVFVAINGTCLAQFYIGDKLKSDAQHIVQQLKKRDIETWLISGDNEQITRHVAQEVGVDHWHGSALPLEKSKLIKTIQAKGMRVAMLGDGINDAPALAQADLSLAMGTGTDVAMNTADVTIVKGDLSKVVDFLFLADQTLKIIKQNLFLSLIYNIICIPLAAGLLYPFTGWLLPPAFASIAMGLSSISVISNSLRIKRFI